MPQNTPRHRLPTILKPSSRNSRYNHLDRFYEKASLNSDETELVSDVGWKLPFYESFEYEAFDMLLYFEKPLVNRFLKWMEFLRSLKSSNHFDGITKGLVYCFKAQIFINKQTEFQFEQSKRFLLELESTEVDSFGLISPRGFIICILMCSKRPDIMNGTIKQIIKKHKLNSPEATTDWFELFFGENNPYYFLGKYLEELSSFEVEFLLSALSGESLRKNCQNYFPMSQKEQALLCSGSLNLINLQSPILDRYIIAARLLQFDSDAIQLVQKHITQSSVFKNKLKTFIKDIDFWQAVVTLFQKELRKNPDYFPEYRVNHLIDYLEFHRYTFIEDIPYSVKGRTVASLERDMEQWHEMQEYPATREELKERWQSLDLGVFTTKRGNNNYRIEELNTGIALLKEGRRMKHCVFSYLNSCTAYGTHIFSLRKKRKQGYKHLVTIEVKNGNVKQAHCRYNGPLNELQEEIIEEWKRNLEMMGREAKREVV